MFYLLLKLIESQLMPTPCSITLGPLMAFIIMLILCWMGSLHIQSFVAITNPPQSPTRVLICCSCPNHIVLPLITK